MKMSLPQGSFSVFHCSENVLSLFLFHSVSLFLSFLFRVFVLSQWVSQLIETGSALDLAKEQTRMVDKRKIS